MDLIFTFTPDETLLSLPVWLDLTALIVGSIFGTLTACERKLDLIGAVGLAIVCGLGGGLIRDTIMQVGSVYMIDSPYAIPTALATALVVFFFHGLFFKIPNVLEWFDIFSIGLFAAAGTDKAMVYGLTFFAAILMGTMTGVGGGLMRDTFLGDVPNIFKRSNFYALCAVLGSVVYFACVMFVHLRKPLAVAVCVLVTVLLRRVSLRYNLLSPADVDLSPKVIVVGRKARTAARDASAARLSSTRRRAEYSRAAREARNARLHDKDGS